MFTPLDLPRLCTAAVVALGLATSPALAGPPVNDECDGALAIADGETPFSTIGATDSGPELPASCDEGFGVQFVQDIWFSYSASCSGSLTISTCNTADYDTRLAAYAGCAGNLVACNDDGPGCAGFTSEMVFEVNSGKVYLIRLGGFGGAGTGTLSITCEAAGGPCPADGDCCADGGNGTPGCEDAECCELICGQDAFCCDVSWDGICAGAAQDQCETCSPGGPCPADGDCCEPHDNPGCDDTDCCLAVCAIDPFCCDVAWDELCVGEVDQVCAEPCAAPICGPGNGDCCAADGNGTPGCDDVECCELICAQDAFCCDVSWDGICAGAAQDQCEVCASGDPCPADGSCCEPHDNPGCDDAECCFSVCAIDPFCCDVSWDELCAGEAEQFCGSLCVPPCPGEGSCCENNGTPGCDDFACCDLICAQDAFCCDVSWDGICADAALEMCEVCQPITGACCLPDGSCVDGVTQEECETAPAGCGDCNSGGGGTPGCSDAVCQDIVCALDSFCCDVAWDSICDGEAEEFCDCFGGLGGVYQGDDTNCADNPCVIDAFLDIKPGSCPNAFNPSSRGYTPVAVLGTADFDVTMIDLESVIMTRADGVGTFMKPNFGPPGPSPQIGDAGTPFEGDLCDCHEMEGDGIDDLKLKFKTPGVVSNLELGDIEGGTAVEIVVSGVLMDGTPFVSSDCIVIVPVSFGSGPGD